MKIEVANSLSGYIETLYILNKKLIKLCGSDYYTPDYEFDSKAILDIIQDIPRLIPYSKSKDGKKLEYKNRDGLLEYSNDIDYLKNDYDEILKNNYDFLDKIKDVRNKYEHKLHDIQLLSYGGGSLIIFEFILKIEDKIIKIDSDNLIKLIKQLNKLFSKIIIDIKACAEANNKQEYPYYKKISRFDFNDFNLIYESDLLRKIGKALYNF
ncbi:hypothetical protein RBG61_05310 [Paludicola sp. MB14-C6]|uniref:hypothetical protein n=1 Tax=Paludihabitans sp. MB14-C6 TaxID=3070656 RepID=UPI0027DDA544|nr:hypothetical protein [Paludicola sp. MB14-C6]WMJ24089.1 hypothetical protein RBG61_05310 [Paludicola sp. MB14-C6]